MNNPTAHELPNDVVLSVRHVSKKFCRNLRRSMWYGMQDLGRNLLGIRPKAGVKSNELRVTSDELRGTSNGLEVTRDESSPPRHPSLLTPHSSLLPPLRRDEFWAVEDVSFDLHRGEILGIIGANGSGKSTLLRVLTGVLPPDTGEVRVRGRLGSLIALGAGFHGHMTGRENIYLNAAILGLKRKQVDERFQDIVDFADIGDFLEAPVSTYSSGMYVRLGFAIAIHTLPDIVLIDEILAVGDARFQRKCLDRIREMRKEGRSFILVSHNMQNIEAMCSRVLWLNHGKTMMIGPTEEVVPRYELMQMKVDVSAKSHLPDEHSVLDSTGLQRVFAFYGYGTDKVRVEGVSILDEQGQSRKEFTAAEPATVRITLCTPKELPNAYVWLVFRHVEDAADREKDVACVGVRIQCTIPKDRITMDFPFEGLQFATGLYKVSFAIFDETYLNPYTQGHYGYFTVKNPIPTMLWTGKSAPFLWLQSAVTIAKGTGGG